MIKWITVLTIISFLLGCASEQETKLREFKKNKNNFPDLVTYNTLDVQWEMSKWFTKITSSDYQYYDCKNSCLAKEHCFYLISSLSTYFTIEKFNKKELEDFQFLTNGSSKINGLKFHYEKLIKQSIISANQNNSMDISETKTYKTKSGFKIQEIIYYSNDNYGGRNGSGMVAFMHRNDEYYVLKYYTSWRSMGLIADDFRAMTRSLR